MSTQSWSRRLLAIVALAVAFVALGASGASATPGIPIIPDCKDAPTAAVPDQGMSGLLDPGPVPAPPAADPFAASSSTTIYDQYGYAGLRWDTYDLGCGGSVRDPQASVDTMLGNALLSAGVFVTALTNGVHNKVAHPEDYMAPLDEVVDKVSGRLHDAIWSPWGGAALLGVVALLLVYSMRGELSSVVSASLWAALVLAILSGVAAYPSRAASFFDSAVTSTIGSLQSGSATLSSVGGADPARAQGALSVDSMLYQGWVRGTLGSSDSAAAHKWGPELFRASALTRSEADASRDPQEAKRIADAKAEDWKRVAGEIETADPSTYAVLQGKAGGRVGTGFLTFVGALATTGFRALADAFLVAGLVMLRLLVMFLPAAAVVGIMAPLSSIIRRMANIAAASLVNVVALSAGSVVHTTAVSAILSSSHGAGMSVMALILCLVLTVAALVLMMPFLSMTRMLGGHSRHGFLRSVKRNALRYAVNRKANQDGLVDALEDRKFSPVGVPEAEPRLGVADPPRSETYRRAVPIWDVTSDGVSPRPSAGPVGIESSAAGGSGSTGSASGERVPREALWDDERRVPRRPVPQLLVGQVVATSPDVRHMRLVRPHDGNVEVRDDGTVGHDIFDPDDLTDRAAS